MSRLGSLVHDQSSNPANLIVFLHGFGGEAVQWRPLFKSLPDLDARLVALDLPGHGGSLRYPGAGSAKVAADAVIAELEQMAAPAWLVGHSKGGAVAGLVALFRPDLVRGIVFLAPGGFGPVINGRLLRAYAAVDERTGLNRILPEFYAPGYKVPLTTRDRMLGMRARGGKGPSGQVDMLKSIVKVIVREDDSQGTLPLEKIAGLGKPLKVLWGDADAVLPVEQAKALGNGFDVEILPGVGHTVYEEAPEAVVRALSEMIGTDTSRPA